MSREEYVESMYRRWASEDEVIAETCGKKESRSCLPPIWESKLNIDYQLSVLRLENWERLDREVISKQWRMCKK